MPEFILKLGKDIYDIYIRTSMNDQKENDLMLNMSPIIKHQIDVEDEIESSIMIILIGVAA